MGQVRQLAAAPPDRLRLPRTRALRRLARHRHRVPQRLRRRPRERLPRRCAPLQRSMRPGGRLRSRSGCSGRGLAGEVPGLLGCSSARFPEDGLDHLHLHWAQPRDVDHPAERTRGVVTDAVEGSEPMPVGGVALAGVRPELRGEEGLRLVQRGLQRRGRCLSGASLDFMPCPPGALRPQRGWRRTARSSPEVRRPSPTRARAAPATDPGRPPPARSHRRPAPTG